MPQTKLGLPIEYKKMPEFFDAHNVCDNTDAKNAVLEELLSEHKVRTVLDLTCGTGAQVFYLANLGYEVVGSDFSPALIKIAKKKASTNKMPVKFMDGDMRTIKLGRFDAVISMFNAVGHLTKADFEKAIKNIGKNLKDGGIYVFDILNLDAMNDRAVKALSMDFTKMAGDTKIHNIQYSEIDRKNGRLISYDSYNIQKGNEAPKKLKNRFTLQIYNAKEIAEMLARNGFEVILQLGMDGSKFINDKTKSILTVAKKK